jgi:hypothetical protein
MPPTSDRIEARLLRGVKWVDDRVDGFQGDSCQGNSCRGNGCQGNGSKGMGRDVLRNV